MPPACAVRRPTIRPENTGSARLLAASVAFAVDSAAAAVSPIKFLEGRRHSQDLPEAPEGHFWNCF